MRWWQELLWRGLNAKLISAAVVVLSFNIIVLTGVGLLLSFLPGFWGRMALMCLAGAGLVGVENLIARKPK